MDDTCECKVTLSVSLKEINLPKILEQASLLHLLDGISGRGHHSDDDESWQ